MLTTTTPTTATATPARENEAAALPASSHDDDVHALLPTMDRAEVVQILESTLILTWTDSVTVDKFIHFVNSRIVARNKRTTTTTDQRVPIINGNLDGDELLDQISARVNQIAVEKQALVDWLLNSVKVEVLQEAVCVVRCRRAQSYSKERARVCTCTSSKYFDLPVVSCGDDDGMACHHMLLSSSSSLLLLLSLLLSSSSSCLLRLCCCARIGPCLLE